KCSAGLIEAAVSADISRGPSVDGPTRLERSEDRSLPSLPSRSEMRQLWLPAGGDARRQPRFVAPGGIAMNNALARHPVDERDSVLQRSFGGTQIVAVDCRADAFERPAQTRPELTVALAVLQALTMRFERRCVTGQDVLYLRNL